MKTGVQLIADERARQIQLEGHTPRHDDAHQHFELAKAADSYITLITWPDEEGDASGKSRPQWDWPFELTAWKPSNDPLRNLVKAGALIAAEIDRLQRSRALNKST